jgi:hypothetical protein
MGLAQRIALGFALIAVPAVVCAQLSVSRPVKKSTQADTDRKAPAAASQPAPAAAGPLRILLVDDDFSDNNNDPGDKRQTPSDRIFRQVVADAVGGNPKAWEIEYVKPYASGPGIERLRPFSLIVWYTGSIYGGNPDNSGVLSVEDEKTVRRYLQEVGGTVILFSPGYLSKVLGASGTWEKTDWKFLTEVVGARGGHGLAQRFLAGTVTAPDGTRFNVDKGSAVESQFSLVNPAGASVLFSTVPAGAKPGSTAAPVATSHAYGKGRFIYVGFSFENLAAAEQAPVFGKLLAASGLQRGASPAVAAAPAATAPLAASVPEAEPTTVQVSGSPAAAEVRWTQQTATITNVALGGSGQTTARAKPKPAATQDPTVKVERLVPNAAPVRLSVASPDTGQARDTGPFAPGQPVTYRVTLTDAQGRAGYKEASFTPQAKDPDNLSATPQADGSVVLVWPEVPGVLSYQIKVDDPRIAPVIVRNATEWRSLPLDTRSRRWTVNSVYEPGGSLTAAASWPSAHSVVVPKPGAVFLSKSAGPGNITEATAHYRKQCGAVPLQNCRAENMLLTSKIWQEGTWGKFAYLPAEAGKPAALGNVRTYPTPRFFSVSFADQNDLGRGRRVGCADSYQYAQAATFICWASSHGHVPAPGASINGVALARAAEQYTDRNDISLTTIVISSKGAMFGAWAPPQPPWPALAGGARSEGPAFGSPVIALSNDWWQQSKNDHEPDWLRSRNWDLANLAPWQREAIVAAVAQPALASTFDSEGPKSVPHACLSCHGGRYDASTGLVQGASLLPLVPSELAFSSPAVRTRVAGDAPYPDYYQDSETAIRGINTIVLRSNPSPAIKERLSAMYGAAGPQGFNSPRASDLAVPPGWSTQRGLYLQVIAPYCGSCHFAQTGPLAFGSWAEVLRQKESIQRAVCTDFTMPHSEIQFRKFWSAGGAVSLPGLLSTALGFPKCPT